MYRLFVAIDFPEQIKQAIGRLAFGLPGAKWVPEDQIHLTLRFVGEVQGDVFKDLREDLHAVRAEPLNIQLRGLGYFPPRKTPRVLWIGLEKNDALAALRNKVESVAVKNGLEPEVRKFSPHVTIARLKDTPLQRLTNFLAGNNLFALPAFYVSDFHLYSSMLTPKGAIHTVEQTYQLKTG